MKKSFTLLIVSLLCIHVFSKEILVPEGLNKIPEAMMEADSGDVLLLEHEKYYPYNLNVSTTNKAFSIKAVGDKYLDKPRIFPIPNDAGNNPNINLI